MRVFVDFLSQPSRAVVWFCKLLNIPHEVVEVRLSKLEHRTPEFRKVLVTSGDSRATLRGR